MFIFGIQTFIPEVTVSKEELEHEEFDKEYEYPEEKSGDLDQDYPSVDDDIIHEEDMVYEDELEIFRGKVLSIEAGRLGDDTVDLFSGVQYANVELLSGPLEGETYEIENIITGQSQYDIHLEEGQEVLLAGHYEDGQFLQLHLFDVARDKYIYYALGLFIVLMLLIGGLTGLKTILTLVFTGFMLLKSTSPFDIRGV